MQKRLFIDGRLIAMSDNLGRVIAPSRTHPDCPLTLDGSTVWKRNNLHLSWYRDESGEYQGWTNGNAATADRRFRGEHGAWRVKSADGLKWEDAGGATRGLTVIRDDGDPDPNRRYKTISQWPILLDNDGNVEAGPDEMDKLVEAYKAGRKVEHGMVVATSPDGMNWGNYTPCVLNTFREWTPDLDMARNPDGKPKVEHKWWKPGEPGWAGGDNFPCLVHIPEQNKYVAFYRTNIDRRHSLRPKGGRRERGVGRSESTDFTNWTDHELALRSDVTWQEALGHGKQDFYQMQVWRVAGIYFGIVSVFYWQEDRNRLELAWSPDSFHWERICPYTDFIPHGELGNFGGGCSYAAMRPQEIDGEVRVYYGADDGKHNADSDRRSTLMLALFKPDRIAGLAPGGMARGALTTVPLELNGGTLKLNVDASAGEVRAALKAEDGSVVDGYGLDDCVPVAGDALDAPLVWNDRPTVPEGIHSLELEVESATLYAVRED